MPHTIKREDIKTFVVIAAFIIAAVVMFFVLPTPKGKAYDCGMAEWHPDIPNSVKEECRALRTKNFQDDLKKPK